MHTHSYALLLLVLLCYNWTSVVDANHGLPHNCTNPVIDCAGRGQCISNTTCLCDKGYVTLNCESTQCCYTQVTRVKVFLLAFFLGKVGAGYFSIGQTGLGVGILLLFVGGLIMGPMGRACLEQERYGSKWSQYGWALMSAVGYLSVFAACLWWLIVWIMLAAETEPFNDSNGAAIAPW